MESKEIKLVLTQAAHSMIELKIMQEMDKYIFQWVITLFQTHGTHFYFTEFTFFKACNMSHLEVILYRSKIRTSIQFWYN